MALSPGRQRTSALSNGRSQALTATFTLLRWCWKKRKVPPLPLRTWNTQCPSLGSIQQGSPTTPRSSGSSAPVVNCAERQCPNWVATAPWYNIILTGTNAQGQPIRVAIDLKLPQSPPKLQRRPSQETLAASPLSPASVPGSDSGPVPFQTVGNHVLVLALLNQKEYATLLVDTGATHTFLTPDTVKRLAVSPAADAPMHTTTVIGGRQVEFPLVLLSSIAVGQAMRENLQVGVLASFPNAPLVDGILGGSFLKDFTMTLDYATSRLRLVLKEPLPTPPPTPALALATRRSAVPIQLVGNQVLVRAVLNHTEHVTLLLDTGAIYTLLTPTTAQRLGAQSPG